jgi:cephalosporin-C deacetylase-like acetyl esterase
MAVECLSATAVSCAFFDLWRGIAYQGLVRHLPIALLAALALASIAVAQEPGNAPEQLAPPARPRPTAPPLAHPDANSPAQAGRTQLNQYLDDVAARDEADRRANLSILSTRTQAEQRQSDVRAKILALLGGLPEKTPMNPRITGSTQLAGFHIEKVLFDSQPNFPVTALLYIPDSHSSKLPAIVMAPGHGPTGKASDFAMASTFARNGFAVLSYDPIGQGERLQYPDPAHPNQSLATRPTGEHGEAGLQPTLIGDAVARYFAWDGMRAVDYLLSRPEIDPDRIGAFGCSGGGAMTALLGALDPRVHAVATACYITSMDTLLPSIGPQDAEQSTPNWIAGGPQGEGGLALDLPDWVELAAPRPYAIVGTVSDMFPWAGLLASAKEARDFYALFDPTAAGTPPASGSTDLPPTPTGPTLNPDTPNTIAASAPLQVIAGIGGHGNLRPLTSQIVSFFLVHLAHSTAAPILPPPPAPGASPFAAPNVPPGTLQVTPTGQVVSSYPGCETIHTLNLKRAAAKLPRKYPRRKLPQLQAEIRAVTHTAAAPHPHDMVVLFNGGETPASNYNVLHLTIPTDPGIRINASVAVHSTPGRKPAVLLVTSQPLTTTSGTAADRAAFDTLAKAGNVVLAITPRPSPPGSEETKSPILGPFYLTELRAELVGKTLLGMRVDDVIQSIDYLANRADVDPARITAVASGHMGLVLLHAAVLDPRLQHITVDHTLASYRSLLEAPLPLDAPQDILPGVLLHYDIPDLTHALGKRLTFTAPLPGTANLATSQ